MLNELNKTDKSSNETLNYCKIDDFNHLIIMMPWFRESLDFLKTLTSSILQ